MMIQMMNNRGEEMVSLYYGRDWKENSERALREVCDRANQKQAGQILLVPEQNSFDAEWKLCEAGGDSISRYAEVLSFSRLATRVFSQVGGAAVQTLDQSGRLIAMAGALEQLRPKLKLYGGQITKPEFLLQLLRIADEFHSYGIRASAVRKVLPELSSMLSEKMEELLLIVDAYDAVCAGAIQDPSSVLARLTDALWDSNYAQTRRFVIDGFSDFTEQEHEILEALIARSPQVSIYLTCDGLHGGSGAFALPRQTAVRVQRSASSYDIPCVVEQILPGQMPPVPRYLAESLFVPGAEPWNKPAPELCLGGMETTYGECEGAVARLQRLILGGARFRDVGVAFSDRGKYLPLLESLFFEYNIPYYTSGSQELLRQSVIRTVVFALEAACCGMEAKSVSEYLKSGFAPITRDEADRLENYAYTWNIHGLVWEKPFTLDPAGLRGDRIRTEEELSQLLLPLNRSRDAAIRPLLQLKYSVSAADNTGEQVLALEEFLNRIGLEERLRRKAEDEQRQGNLQAAQQCGQLYDILLSTMEQIFGVLGRTVRTPEEFYRFFRAALSQNTVSTIPASLDCVRVGQLSAMRHAGVKHMIVLGASDGQLPSCGTDGGLLSDAERIALKQAGIQVAPDSAERLGRELLTAYTVFTAPTESLSISCDVLSPSYLFTRLEALFPQCSRPVEMPFPVSAVQAAAQMAGMPEKIRRQVEELLPELTEPMEQLLHRAAYSPGILRPEQVLGLYGRVIRLSSSKIDRFASCKMAYFLRYGMRAEERKQAQVDAAQYGLFVHYVLEHTVNDVRQRGGFRILEEDTVAQIALGYCDLYVQESLGELTERSKREEYLLRRNYREIEAVVRNLYREMHDSAFDPVFCELKFEKDTAISVEGALARGILEGIVDRVDLFTNEAGHSYLRVVDYKSGTKDFNYTDVLHGIGLQMLIYLFALTKSAERFFHSPAEPAGVLYFPTRYGAQYIRSRPTPEEAEKERRSSLRRKGLLLDDDEVLWAMEPKQKPEFLPFDYVKKDNARKGYLASREDLSLLQRHVGRLLAQLTDEMYCGVVDPDPYCRDEEHSACRWCEYRQVCHIQSGEVPLRRRKSISGSQFWTALRQEEEHG